MSQKDLACPTNKIPVHRKGGWVKGHEGYTRKDGTDVSPVEKERVWRNPADYCTIDKGAPGKGKKLPFKEKSGRMTEAAVKLGYIDKGQRVSDIPNSKMDDFAIDLAKDVKPDTAFRMFHSMVIKRKGAKKGSPEEAFRTKMEIGRETIANEFPSDLTPRAAIKKWKSMTTEERRRARKK